MNRPILHFVHANSFPAGTYRRFFEELRPHYDIQALDLHAHDPRYPVQVGWQELARELADQLIGRYSSPVILAGHSMGGMLSLLVAKTYPELVRGVVLLDAPVIAGWRAWVVRRARNSWLGEKISPARISARRRNIWPNVDSAFQHYAAKDMFAIWAQGVLQDYIEHGLVSHPDGVTLRFKREVETAVYRTLPDHIGLLVKSGLPVPVGFVGGKDSVECRQAGLGATRRLVGAHFKLIAGGHLFPMESPVIAAATVHTLIQEMFSISKR